MNVAFLFNSDDPSLGTCYGDAVLRLIAGTGVLQKHLRPMRVSIGDTGTYAAVARFGERKTVGEVIEWDLRLYSTSGWHRLKLQKLADVLGAVTIYCWMFQNITQATAEELDSALRRRRSYMGAMELDFSYPLHLQFFRNSLSERYRVEGVDWHEFRSMGETEEGFDVAEKDILNKFGCTLEIEDVGARRTIFDNFDQRAHFARVRDFERYFGRVQGWSGDDTSQLVFDLEEIHPALFDVLAASVRTLSRAETVEDVAQVALSGRRFLEQLADALYPPKNKPVDGKKVGRAEYKNRLWAYIKSALNETGLFDETRFRYLGSELDRLIEVFNKGLHGQLEPTTLLAAYAALARWVVDVVALNPRKARRPYAAYNDEIMKFFEEIVQNREAAPRNGP